MTGIFWFEDRRDYHHTYNLLVVLPCLLLIAIGRTPLPPAQATRPLLTAVAAFIGWAALSTLWLTDPATTSRSVSDMLRHATAPIWLLFAALSLGRCPAAQLRAGLQFATVSAALSVLVFLVLHHVGNPGLAWWDNPDLRLIGFFGLQVNSLLTAHVIGFFVVVAAALAAQQRLFWFAYTVLVAGLIACGARTALIAVGMATLVVLFGTMRISRRLIFIGMLAITAGAVLLGDMLLARGLSYRPEIWLQAWQEILEHPWWGTGWGSAWHYRIAAQTHPVDAHNLTLAVWRDLGSVGLLLWLAIWIGAGIAVWRRRSTPLAKLALGLLSYGVLAGVTEGVAYLSRPKEHWFIIWLPLAISLVAIANPPHVDAESQESQAPDQNQTKLSET
ncbi:MAG: O-antigen ligase family protein [Pseudomonadota bacterium]